MCLSSSGRGGKEKLGLFGEHLICIIHIIAKEGDGVENDSKGLHLSELKNGTNSKMEEATMEAGSDTEVILFIL